MKKILTILILLGGVAAGLLTVRPWDREVESVNSGVDRAIAETVTIRTLTDEITIRGELRRDELQSIDSSTDGRISDIGVEAGEVVAEGDALFTVDGRQAVAVHAISPPDDLEHTGLADLDEIDPEIIRNAPLQPARVKWFDKGKGFGFANTFGRDEDVFVHIEVLRRSGLADVQPGEALAIRVIDGKRGRMATEVCGWETAVKLSE